MKKATVIFCLLSIFLCGCASLSNNASGFVLSEAEREKKIEKEIEKIDGIYSCVVVIRGKAALIGVTVERGYEHRNNDIKSAAAQTARNTDRDVVSTAVTSNVEITEMIRNLKRLSR